MSLEILNGYKPSDCGLDPKDYPTFRTDPLSGREVQLEAIEFGVYCDRWLAAGRIPTGVGKMVVAWCLHKLTGLRTAILTGTKGLQDQYQEKLGGYGLVDSRGRSNYTCQEFTSLNCRAGYSMGCRYRNGGGCTYEGFRDIARNAGCTSTNYKYWMTLNDKANGLERTAEDAQILGSNPIELLVLDEAHHAASQLADYLGFRLKEPDISAYVDTKMMGEDLGDWQRLAVDAI